MEVLESALLAEFIGYIKSSWWAQSREDQRRRLLRQLVSKVVARLSKTVEELERLAAGPGDDLDVFAGVLSLDAAAAATRDDMDVDGAAAMGDDMDVDGRPAPGGAAPRHRQEGSGAPAGSVAGALLPSPGNKRKRACGGGGGEVDAVQPQKRRLLAWTRPHQRLPSGSRRVSSAPRKPPPPPAALPRSRRARTVALAMSKIKRRIGKPTTRATPQPSLGQRFSRITL